MAPFLAGWHLSAAAPSKFNVINDENSAYILVLTMQQIQYQDDM
jgi:hypothetical protein